MLIKRMKNLRVIKASSELKGCPAQNVCSADLSEVWMSAQAGMP
jgi:hypothetical protein